MEDLVMFDASFWIDRKVLVTGHTGFKGSWLSLWLDLMGAKVAGIALPPVSNFSLFEYVEKFNCYFKNEFFDIRDNVKLRKSVSDFQPDIVFHMAAQPLVREGYKNPLDTWSTNVMGSLNLLNSLTELKNTCAVVMVTTDKVYKNREWNYGYRETDRLGGYDPYSASKAACELAISSWRSSYCGESSHIAIASARSGNVIGGGDWAKDRIIPDAIRAFIEKEKLMIRNPSSTRPWQHVLEPLSGYILLAENLYKEQKSKKSIDSNSFSTAFNFGPEIVSNRTVAQLVEEIKNYLPEDFDYQFQEDSLHEAGRLNLQTDKAFHLLNWYPKWDFEKTVKQTINWYRVFIDEPFKAYELCKSDINLYMKNTKKLDF